MFTSRPEPGLERSLRFILRSPAAARPGVRSLQTHFIRHSCASCAHGSNANLLPTSTPCNDGRSHGRRLQCRCAPASPPQHQQLGSVFGRAAGAAGRTGAPAPALAASSLTRRCRCSAAGISPCRHGTWPPCQPLREPPRQPRQSNSICLVAPFQVPTSGEPPDGTRRNTRPLSTSTR